MKLSLLFSCLLSLFLATPAHADGHAPRGTISPAKGGYLKVHASGARITDVSATSITVKEAKKVRTYQIGKLTSIKVDGNKAGAQALRKGMFVNVTTSQLDAGMARSIEATTGAE